MDNWLIRKPRSVSISKEEAPNVLERKLDFRFKDALYKAHSNGHQRRSEGSTPSLSWMHMREQKIQSQFPDRSSDIFKGVNIYINGWTGDNKDLRLKKLVAKHGGNVSYALAQRKVTHVIVQNNVCASKLHKHLHVRSNLTKVVNSDWIMDSIANGKRLSEWKYRVLKDETQQDLLSQIKVHPNAKPKNIEPDSAKPDALNSRVN
ncbi:BRCT domain-containing protein [Umbelopsis sp. PMI_123]|nr:BRCT domain-containing protein [Umbelopsis sp. PMI_123]